MDFRTKAIELGEGCTERYLKQLEEGLREAHEAGRREAALDLDTFEPKCYDKAHDDRWCQNCESMVAGIDQAAQWLEASCPPAPKEMA